MPGLDGPGIWPPDRCDARARQARALSCVRAERFERTHRPGPQQRSAFSRPKPTRSRELFRPALQCARGEQLVPPRPGPIARRIPPVANRRISTCSRQGRRGCRRTGPGGARPHCRRPCGASGSVLSGWNCSPKDAGVTDGTRCGRFASPNDPLPPQRC
jgi:hypothetical protein